MILLLMISPLIVYLSAKASNAIHLSTKDLNEEVYRNIEQIKIYFLAENIITGVKHCNEALNGKQ